ncbi:hypothetical protein [Duncaniella dubosii]|uniref:hypothetical protein n=1 Tax=Duncaniella dubosii TaxID=2518971 RepID=UPI003F676BF3
MVDISTSNFEEQIEVVDKDLREVCDRADKQMNNGVHTKSDAFNSTLFPKGRKTSTRTSKKNASL